MYSSEKMKETKLPTRDAMELQDIEPEGEHIEEILCRKYYQVSEETKNRLRSTLAFFRLSSGVILLNNIILSFRYSWQSSPIQE